MATELKRSDEVTVTVERFASEGNGFAHVNGQVLFVRGGVPGDTVRTRLTRITKSFLEGTAVDITTPSPLRRSPQCRYFGTCGGCTWQHVSYQAQLDFKRQQVIDALERIGGFTGIRPNATLGSEEEYYYRNKMEFSFGERWLSQEEMTAPEGPDRFALGLHIPRRFDRVLDIDECWLQSSESSRIVNAVRRFCTQRNLVMYSPRTHTGYLRNLVIREGRNTGERMINVVTSESRPDVMEPLTALLCEEFPSTTTIVNNITTSKSGVAVGEREVVYHGTGTIRERIGRQQYRISANSFFQTNTKQAERLYAAAQRMAGCSNDDIVFDLYSGTGTIALYIADAVKSVVGIEAVASAVDDARSNAAENGVSNCTFVLGDLKDRLTNDADRPHDRPSVIITDPPRSGMHPRVITEIAKLAPRRIVYISCNPATQARDLGQLCAESAYAIDEIQPVDMFPHTHHVENIISLAKQ
jgi:23S rRNA (uracil1939-C5)-methyltransferase